MERGDREERGTAVPPSPPISPRAPHHSSPSSSSQSLSRVPSAPCTKNSNTRLFKRKSKGNKSPKKRREGEKGEQKEDGKGENSKKREKEEVTIYVKRGRSGGIRKDEMGELQHLMRERRMEPVESPKMLHMVFSPLFSFFLFSLSFLRLSFIFVSN